MLTQEDYWMIQELHQQGVYRGDIAERLGVHRKTVGRALERGGPPSSKRRRERYAKLKPYMETVDKLLKAGVFNAGGHLPRDPGPGIRRQDSRPACLHRAQARPATRPRHGTLRDRARQTVAA